MQRPECNEKGTLCLQTLGTQTPSSWIDRLFDFEIGSPYSIKIFGHYRPQRTSTLGISLFMLEAKEGHDQSLLWIGELASAIRGRKNDNVKISFIIINIYFNQENTWRLLQ